VFLLLLFGRSRVGLGRGMSPTDSLVERFATITIIVLGEVVFGVVEGLSQSKRDFTAISTGMPFRSSPSRGRAIRGATR
jgi:hypothetical protein